MEDQSYIILLSEQEAQAVFNVLDFLSLKLEDSHPQHGLPEEAHKVYTRLSECGFKQTDPGYIAY